MATKSDPAESVADLKRLYNVEATVEYTSRHGLVRTLRTFLENWDRFLDHTVLITKFPPQVFDTEEDNIPAIPWKGKNLYFRNSKILISTMAGRPHEVLSRAIDHLFYDKVKSMNCETDWLASGTAKASLGNINKAPDESWGPISAGYATCILEVGMTESIRALDVDAQRWIKNEPSHVTQALTAKIYPHREEIIFAVWRSSASRQPVRDDEVRVTKHRGRPRVVSDKRTLRLNFEKIFERPATQGTTERDVIFTARELCRIAITVWDQMELGRRG
ncbi:hypothetical protein OIDMADRAFT_26053 [Oidiodendron maius Zn]|uniref:Uncharacterized protein n=1 Tax=Oidiodendron maius (strain Zn) TaxID=913774 RepID=A0A0C3HJT3_OIDMZ|nr:hypothetical protein OIDMADRAFT_26053 [Oidiodendron maius Zn]